MFTSVPTSENHVPSGVITCVFTFITGRLRMSRWFFLRLWRWCQYYSGLSVLWVPPAVFARTRGLQDELNELWPLFSYGGESVDVKGFPQAGLSLWSSMRPIAFISSSPSYHLFPARFDMFPSRHAGTRERLEEFVWCVTIPKQECQLRPRILCKRPLANIWATCCVVLTF